MPRRHDGLCPFFFNSLVRVCASLDHSLKLVFLFVGNSVLWSKMTHTSSSTAEISRTSSTDLVESGRVAQYPSFQLMLSRWDSFLFACGIASGLLAATNGAAFDECFCRSC